jgi:hypothetical protein
MLLFNGEKQDKKQTGETMYNDKLTLSIAEAAKKCMDEELKGQQHKIDANKNNKIDAHDFKLLRAKKDVKEEMQKSDVPAYLRKQKGETPLTVADVKAPRKDSISSKENLAKARNEEVEQVTEADVEKTATGMKVYGSSYGNSVRARREQIKKSIDTAKGPKMKDIASIEAEKKTKKKFTEMVESYVESGIKGLFESFVKEEVTNDQFKKELDKQQSKADGKAPQADVAAPAVQSVKNEEVEQLDELSPGTLKSYVNKAKPEMKAAKDERQSARETGDYKSAGAAGDVVNKRTAGIKTAKAKLNAEEVEQIDEISIQTMKSAKEKLGDKAFDAHMDDNKYAAQHYASRAMKMKKKIAQKERQVAKEEVEQVEERTLTEPETKKKEEVVKSMKKGLQGFKDRYGADAKSVMYATATKIAKKD